MDSFYSVGLLVSRASVALSKALNAAILADNIDLPHSQFIVLRCLYYQDEISQFDLANLLSKDAAAIKRTVDELEKKGFVKRKQIRNLKNSVCITDQGKALMPQLLEIADRVKDDALKGISEKERKLLKELLEKIYINTENKKR